MAINLDRDVIIDVNLDNGQITRPNNASYYNTDSNIAFFYIKLHKTTDIGVVEYVKKEEANNYEVKMKVVKPKSLNTTTVTSTQSNDLIDGNCALYKFTIENSLLKEVGDPFCYVSVAYDNQELTTDGFTYHIKQDPLSQYNLVLLNDPDMPLLLKLIEQIQKSYNIDDVNVNDYSTFSSRKIISLLENKADKNHIWGMNNLSQEVKTAINKIPEASEIIINDINNNFVSDNVEGVLNEVGDKIKGKQDKLVSGTNIKTINGISLLGDGDISINDNPTNTEDYITEGEVDTKLENKQDKLVSGTNIKTINGTSILGSGNIAITGEGGSIDTSSFATKTEVNTNLSKKQDKLVSGTNIKTINGQSLLGNGNIEITGGSTEGPGTETIETDMLSLMTYGKGVDQNSGQGNIVDNAACWATVNSVSVTEGQEYTLTMDGTWMWVFTYDDSDNFVSSLTTGGEDNPQTFTFTPDASNIRFGCYDANRALTYCTLTTTRTTGGGTIDTSKFATKADLAKKQNTLVSGTNIKTINGMSMLGSGNISISGGSSGGSGSNVGMKSVLDFGADNTYSRDNTEAFQAALDHSAATGNTIYFPPGKYKLEGTLYFNQYASLYGGNQQIFGLNEFDTGANQNDVVIITNADVIFKGHNKSESQVELVKLGMVGLTFQHSGNMDTSTFFYKLHLFGSYIHNCLFRQYATVILGTIGYVTMIDHNIFLECRKYFLKSKNIPGLSDPKPAGIVDSYITNNYINGSQYKTEQVGFDVHYIAYSTIHNNFIDFFKAGMQLSGGSGCVITNNQFQYSRRGIVLENAQLHTISNNIFGLMKAADWSGPWTNHGVDVKAAWGNQWVGIEVRYQTSELTMHGNIGVTVDKLIQFSQAGYRNIFVDGNICTNPNDIIDGTPASDSSFPNDGVNIHIQTI